ncbi:MAG: hypothetical protein JO126_00115 [Alphaproteobacteria bacterium]|nr:hypothetical protein [Alphaproteobacteria bacterium]MBV8547848.1 hypothetical protein [Alphaproteobacteria bacterium]
MALKINTFSNQSGGNVFYKAVTHPLVAEKARHLVAHLRKAGPIAIYDPAGHLKEFTEFFPLNDIDVAGYFVQEVDHIGRTFGNHTAQPVTQIQDCVCAGILVASFDAQRLVDHIKHIIPANAPWYSFDALRLPDEMLSDRHRYLSAINFANNFAFFREQAGQHTRVVTANYWGSYGAKDARAFCYLMDERGQKIIEWTEALPAANATIVFDSKEIRARFKLPEFIGQLFIHIVGAAGHDVVKYALDTYGDDDRVLSCTHDANAWPSDQFAGLPAPTADEEVVLWVQNSHPCPIPANAIGMNLMGDAKLVTLGKEIPAYATYRLSVKELLPQAKWPQQIEVQAGKYFVRPRYEVFSKNGHSRISHPNVERVDLTPDRKLADLGNLLGKLHIVPAPILPLDRYVNWLLPTPMSTGLTHLPAKALVYDAFGQQVAEHKFGNMLRSDSVAINLNDLLGDKTPAGGFGHVELIYDFEAGQEADGWLHCLCRYEDKKSGHAAETSFGAHVFNTVLTYRGEPQSYAGKAPGLSTRLFLRTGPAPLDTVCHLMYPASLPWHSTSDTQLILTSSGGHEVARRHVRIPCSGSLLWRTSQMFTQDERDAAGDHAYVLIRDTSCRLFGYHGLVNGDSSFSLDHMFGF